MWSHWRSFDGLHQTPQSYWSGARKEAPVHSGGFLCLGTKPCSTWGALLGDSRGISPVQAQEIRAGKATVTTESLPPADEPCTYSKQSRKSHLIALLTLSSHFTFSLKTTVSTQLSPAPHRDSVSGNWRSLVFVQDTQNLSSVSAKALEQLQKNRSRNKADKII